ncbi:MAG: cysteine desulfurase family protein [Aestuariibaculum sp.]
MQHVYFDNAATTPMRDNVIQAISQVMSRHYGNPSSSHAFGRASKVLIEKSRKRIAQYLNVSAGEIIFTSGGTEADNLILQGAVRHLKIERIITSKTEHHAVLHTVEVLEEEYNVVLDFVNVKADGSIDTDHLETLLQSGKKTLVSLMHINNEIGNILNLYEVSKLCKDYDAFFHTDAVQSVGHYKLDLQSVSVDFLAASAHKFHGPKGVGFAFVRKSLGLKPLITGGEQERGLRAGTENVPNIVGMEAALNEAYQNIDTETTKIKTLKQYFIKKIKTEIPLVKFNGLSESLESSTYTLLNVLLPIPPKKAAMLLFQLDLRGIACSKGSACQSGSNQNSHVLTEILSAEDLQKPSLRFSFSIYNTEAEVDYTVEVLKRFVNNTET